MASHNIVNLLSSDYIKVIKVRNMTVPDPNINNDSVSATMFSNFNLSLPY